MRNNLQDDDPKTIWQSQPTEASTMSLVLIRQKARELRAKARRQLLGTLVVPVVVALFYAFCIQQFPQLRGLLHSLFALALAWSLVGLYFLHRGMRPGAMPGDAAFNTGLEFCRRELERQRDVLRLLLLWSFGPVVMALGTISLAFAIVAGPDIFPKAAPLMTLMVAWIAAYLVIRVRQQRKLQREINELNNVERENGR